MARLSIIIPRHTETEEFMYPLFSSLDNQIGIDWNDVEILLVNDALDNVITDFSRYLHIKPRNLFNKTWPGYPGMSRQIGIDQATGDFIMFCDADDMLHSNVVLLEYFAKMNNTDPNQQFDIMITNFVEEARTADTKQIFYSLHTQDFTWMFGKLYRREYIVKNSIRSHPELRIHEDSYFNCLFRAYGCRVLFQDWPSYIWRYNEGSITRQDDADYSFNSLCVFIDAIKKAILEIQRRNVANVTENVIQLICYIYTLLQTEQWKSERGQTWKPKVEMALAEFIETFADLLTNVDANVLYNYLNQEFNSQTKKSGLFMIQETWDNFISRINTTYAASKMEQTDVEILPPAEDIN